MGPELLSPAEVAASGAALAAVGVPTHGRGVEIGCGPGFFAEGLRRDDLGRKIVGLDVDPFILSLTQTAGKVTPLQIASPSVVIAAASNNLMKGIYALVFAKERGGRLALSALFALALLGLVPLFFL